MLIPDISILVRSGHFYFGLTKVSLIVDFLLVCRYEDEHQLLPVTL